jgi:hypothetical protein
MILVATKKFESELFLERSITPHREPLGNAENEMTLYIDEEGLEGMIEWEYTLADGDGDCVGIGLWFSDGDKKLTDYDGVFEIPKEAIELLKENGYDCSYVEE